MKITLLFYKCSYLNFFTVVWVRNCSVLLLLVVSAVGCKSIEAPADRKIIGDTTYKEVLYVTSKTPETKPKRRYYWYKSQEVHSSENNYSGQLLDGAYTKSYYANQLAEKGYFNKGLKSGAWTNWHKNGKISKTTNWENGKQFGKAISYDSIGKIVSVGKYTNGLKSGKWIYPVKGDTLFFKRGIKVVKDSVALDEPQRKSFFKRIFSKKNKEADVKGVKREKKPNFFKRLFNKKDNNNSPKKQQKTTVKKPKIKKEATKPNFFQRLFKKKDKTDNKSQ